VRGTFLCVKAAIPAMQRNAYGKIINLSSTTML
jgi:NAD(P)-dependent dehydrogenase (short-subunit alcohol dehydrogenase family)